MKPQNIVRIITMKHKALVFFVSFVLVMSMIAGCSKEHESIEYNNEVFTEKMYNEVKEIGFSSSSVDYQITEQEYIDDIYRKLASLTLDEAGYPPSATLGFISFYISTTGDTVEITMAGNSISVLGKTYKGDENTLNEIGDLLANWLNENSSSNSDN